MAALAVPDNQACNVQRQSGLSLPCMECGAEGEFCFYSLEIPHFRSAEISSYSCSMCSYTYRKVHTALAGGPGASVPDKGRRYTLTVTNDDDLRREVVRSDVSTLRIPHVDIEAQSSEGSYTTVEASVFTEGPI